MKQFLEDASAELAHVAILIGEHQPHRMLSSSGSKQRQKRSHDGTRSAGLRFGGAVERALDADRAVAPVDIVPAQASDFTRTQARVDRCCVEHVAPTRPLRRSEEASDLLGRAQVAIAARVKVDWGLLDRGQALKPIRDPAPYAAWLRGARGDCRWSCPLGRQRAVSVDRRQPGCSVVQQQISKVPFELLRIEGRPSRCARAAPNAGAVTRSPARSVGLDLGRRSSTSISAFRRARSAVFRSVNVWLRCRPVSSVRRMRQVP